MYHVAFPPASNRASWLYYGLITDIDDNPIDLTGCELVFAVEDECGRQRLLASTDNGKLTIVDVGTFRVFFTRDEMGSLYAAKTYATGLTLTSVDGTQTVQMTVGPLPIWMGWVP